ncbi:MAG: hypothetical protein PUD23_05430 [Prevotella sp.]|nr:hypothetical protein [Prevotella sp.]
MAKLKEVYEIEGKRSTMEECVKMHVFREGNFFHLYEWSAWLLVIVEKMDLKVTHKEIKNLDGTLLMVGFPESSREKFLPADARTETLTENAFDVMVPVEKLGEGATPEYLAKVYAQWKESVPVEKLKEKTKKEENKDSSGSQALATVSSDNHGAKSVRPVSVIMHDILRFQVESHTPLDCMFFLVKLKEELSLLY